MSDYADSGFICSLYAPDAHTERAISRMERQPDPVLFSWLNQLEFRNALRLRVFRGEIATEQRDASINALMGDVHQRVFHSADPSPASCWIEAERLSARHSEKLETRSLDVLHVAIALVLGAEQFLSFDHRQIRLARAAGLRVPRL